jgi:hypothetical protein
LYFGDVEAEFQVHAEGTAAERRYKLSLRDSIVRRATVVPRRDAGTVETNDAKDPEQSLLTRIFGARGRMAPLNDRKPKATTPESCDSGVYQSRGWIAGIERGCAAHADIRLYREASASRGPLRSAR